VWDPEACHGGTHVSPAERDAFFRLFRRGLTDVYRLHHAEPGRYTWWDYRAGALEIDAGSSRGGRRWRRASRPAVGSGWPDRLLGLT
jgi:exonuclease III